MIRFFVAIKSFFLKLFGRKPIPLLENRVFFSYPEGKAFDAEESVYYSDTYFFQDPSVDNPSLATCSLGLAMASFSSNERRADLEFQAGNAVDFLQKCGFSDIETPQYFSSETQKEGLAFAMAQKTLKQGKKPFALIAIGVRGGNYGKEWASNMEIGLGDRHEGFSLAAKELHLAFVDYVLRHKIKGDVRVWVAGFSRAAAVTNLFAQDLGIGVDKARITDVYAYCFACPNTTRINALAPSSVRNYINVNDMVPLLPFGQWGYGRFGRDIDLKRPSENDDFALIYLNKLHILSKEKRFRRETAGVDKAKYLRELTQLFGERIGINEYARTFQDPLVEFMCLIDSKLENPYQVLTEVVSEAVAHLYDDYGTFNLLRMVLSSKTDWDKVLLPAIEATLKDKPYREQLNPVSVSAAIADFVGLLREDIVSNPNFFLTFFDKRNMASILKEHDPIVYLNALKAEDPKFSGATN